MSITKQRVLEYVDLEWGTYVERLQRLPETERVERIQEMGYSSLRDLLAHVLAWWEEGMGIILAIAQGRPFERKKYDFDVFNAEAVAKYRSWDEPEFMTHFEKSRQKMRDELQSLEESVFENRRVQAWLRAIIVNHAREHLAPLSHFLLLDLLEYNWATYIEDFQRLPPETQQDFLTRQGFNSFHDLLAHIIGWWEEGVRVIRGILNSPSFSWEEHDVDQFNAELTQKYSTWSMDDLFKHYDVVRKAVIDLIERLPEDAFRNKEIEEWLFEDVVRHYDRHSLPV